MSQCVEWKGSKNSKGYGRMRTNGKTTMAHRRSFADYHGVDIPSGMFVCHHCDNPSCVNPEHLFLGTAKDNMQDCLSKGRFPGPRSSWSHCKNGHEFTPENTWIKNVKGGKTQRRCRICHREESKHYWRMKNDFFTPKP